MTQYTENNNRPTHAIYNVIENPNGEKPFWNKLGSAWPHKDGLGFNLKLDAIPLTGSMVIRVQTDKQPSR